MSPHTLVLSRGRALRVSRGYFALSHQCLGTTLACALILSVGCRKRSSHSEDERKQSAEAEAVELNAPPVRKIEGDFVIVAETKGKAHVVVKTNDDSFVSGSGRVDMVIEGDDDTLKKAGLSGFKAVSLENAGQDFKCVKERCAAFYRAVTTEVHGFDILVSVQEDKTGAEPRMLLSWPSSDGLFTTVEAEPKSIHWTYGDEKEKSK